VACLRLEGSLFVHGFLSYCFLITVIELLHISQDRCALLVNMTKILKLCAFYVCYSNRFCFECRHVFHLAYYNNLLHRRSQGALGAPAPPGRRKKIMRNLYGKICKCTPQAEQESTNFRKFFCCAGEIWRVGLVHLVVLASVSSATTKIRSTFLRKKKVHPRENPGYAYDLLTRGCLCCM